MDDNSQECRYFGYKLSSLVTCIGASENVHNISIGCADDDEFYSKKISSTEEVPEKTGRVQIEIETNHDIVFIDLEDVLRFARRYCNGIYHRIDVIETLGE